MLAFCSCNIRGVPRFSPDTPQAWWSAVKTLLVKMVYRGLTTSDWFGSIELLSILDLKLLSLKKCQKKTVVTLEGQWITGSSSQT